MLMVKLQKFIQNSILFIYNFDIRNIICAFTIVVFIIMYIIISTYVKNDSIQVITVPNNSTITTSTIKDSGITESTYTANKIVEQINNSNAPNSVIISSSKLPDKVIKEESKKVLPTTTSIIKQDKDDHTTNVYAIDASKKAQHGIGIYGKYKSSDVKSEAGIFYRNKRIIYNVGIMPGGKYSVGIGYELFQW